MSVVATVPLDAIADAAEDVATNVAAAAVQPDEFEELGCCYDECGGTTKLLPGHGLIGNPW